jgi:hypothetical protein
LACRRWGVDPTPEFGPAEAPAVGTIRLERIVAASGATQRIGMMFDQSIGADRVRVTIPAGAYPAGTRVTFRLVSDLSLRIDTDPALQKFVDVFFGLLDAIQILPAGQLPTVPLHVEIVGHGHPWAHDLLHARETDSAWSVVGTIEATATTLAFDIPEPGLWTLGQLALPPSLQGRLERVELSCDDRVVASAGPRLLDLNRAAYT